MRENEGTSSLAGLYAKSGYAPLEDMYSFVSADQVHVTFAGVVALSRVGEGVSMEESESSPSTASSVSRPGGEGERERADVTSARRDDVRGFVFAASARRRSRLAASRAPAD